MKTSKFKMTEVGTIPDGWSVVPLGDLFSFKNGYNTSAECYGAGTPVASVLEALDWMPLTRSRIRTKVIAPEGARSAFSLKQGDLIFTRSSETLEDVGRSNVYVDDEPAMFGGFIIRGRPKTGNNSRFINFLLKDQKHHERVMSKGAGAQHYNIGQTGLAKVLITLPPLPEQEKIAEALSDIDELISALGKLIEKKRNIKTGTMQELLGMRNAECGMRNVPRRRLAGFSGAWVEKRFDDCFIHVPSKAYQIQATSYLGGGIYDVVDQGQSDVVGYTNDGSRLFRVPKDGVIIFGDHTRIVKFRKKDFVVGADGTQLLIGKDADTKFLSLLLGILEIPNLGYSRHFKYVKEGRYLLPPTPVEQKAIAAVLSDMDAEIAALEAKRAKYESIKQGMMQELLTGKTRLEA